MTLAERADALLHEMGFTTSDGPPVAYFRVPRRQGIYTYVSLHQDGERDTGCAVPLRDSPEEAEEAYLNTLRGWAGKRAHRHMYWRMRPDLQCEDGKANVYSRLIDAPPGRSTKVAR